MKVKVWDSIWSDYFNQISQSEFGMRAMTNRRLGMRKCVRCRVMNIRTLFLAPGSGLIFKRGESTPESQLPLSRSEEQLAYADRRCWQQQPGAVSGQQYLLFSCRFWQLTDHYVCFGSDLQMMCLMSLLWTKFLFCLLWETPAAITFDSIDHYHTTYFNL